MSGSHQGYNVIYDKWKYFYFSIYTRFWPNFYCEKWLDSTRIYLHFSDFSPHCSRRGRRRPIKIRRKSMRKSSLLVVRVKLGKFALSVLLDSFLQPATHCGQILLKVRSTIQISNKIVLYITRYFRVRREKKRQKNSWNQINQFHEKIFLAKSHFLQL